MSKEIRIGKIKVGGKNPLVLIAGPCVIESRESCFRTARMLKRLTSKLNFPFIFKASFDKANRTSINSYRGPGLKEGLKILKEVKKRFGVAVLSDIHCRDQIKQASSVLDIIQIPAFLCRQTDLILAVAGSAKAINIKKGQFLSPWDIEEVIKKVESAKNKNILITERGTCFGYNNLVSDLRALGIMGELGYPVIYDATHSVQLPGAKGISSGGERRFVSALSRAAVAFGCDGVFLEVHPQPEQALCDGPNMIDFKELERLLVILKKIEGVLKEDRCI